VINLAEQSLVSQQQPSNLFQRSGGLVLDVAAVVVPRHFLAHAEAWHGGGAAAASR